MRWSIKIARIAGIDVKIHLTFFLLLAWFAWIGYSHGGAVSAVNGVVFILLVFLCVVLHEFGHALMAKRFGIRTPDITLLPIGGVARLERMPDKPREEVLVAIAGPLVNVAIAILLWIAMAVSGGVQVREIQPLVRGDLLPVMFMVNIWLVLFNMIPAFPMDGGRVLRAFLAMRMNYVKATQIAASIGQGIAFVFGFIGILWNPLLIFIAIFIYLGAAAEAAMAQMKDMTSGFPVASAMVTHFESLPENAILADAVRALISTSQHEFPVVDANGHVLGMLMQNDLIVALHETGSKTPVTEVMKRDVPTVDARLPFSEGFQRMNASQCRAIPVLDAAGRLVGLFTTENVGEMMKVHAALGKWPQEIVKQKNIAAAH